MKCVKMLFLIGFICVISVHANAQRAYWDTVYAQNGSYASLSLYFENILDVASFDIVSDFDPLKLQMIGTNNVNSILGSNGFYVIGPSGSWILSFFSLNSVSFIGLNKILEVKFLVIQDSATMSISSSGLFSNTASGPVPAILSPGYIVPCTVISASSPLNSSVLSGDSTSFSTVITGPGPSTFQWQYSTNGGAGWADLQNTPPYSGVTTNQLSIIPANFTMDQFQYRCVLNGGCGPLATASATLTVESPIIIANFTYNNLTNTPITSCPIRLKQGAVIVKQQNTNTLGKSIFTDFPLGTYTLQPAINKPWGGGNSVDAIMIMKHYTGILTLSGMALQAADANGDGAVNSLDAQLVSKRFVGIISSFPASDWIIENPTVNAFFPLTYVVPIKAVCRGDVNGSYIP
ncbi:MAG: dockerin type I repeat-containing protein [Bacteroidota bacterium]